MHWFKILLLCVLGLNVLLAVIGKKHTITGKVWEGAFAATFHLLLFFGVVFYL